MWTRRPISKTSSTALSSTSSCLSRRSMKRWTRRRKSHISRCTHVTSAPWPPGRRLTWESWSELMWLRFTPDVTSLWARVSLMCLTCLTCIPAKPFLVWHVCWCSSTLSQQIPRWHTQLEKIHLIYLSVAARLWCMWDMGVHFSPNTALYVWIEWFPAMTIYYGHSTSQRCLKQLYH